ncbi:unnamed protein product [Ectocarpus sp. CCAP 1310/34]|nr:unnamed protein product [Ectocarpus sp. CCAP 1310/34]
MSAASRKGNSTAAGTGRRKQPGKASATAPAAAVVPARAAAATATSTSPARRRDQPLDAPGWQEVASRRKTRHPSSTREQFQEQQEQQQQRNRGASKSTKPNGSITTTGKNNNTAVTAGQKAGGNKGGTARRNGPQQAAAAAGRHKHTLFDHLSTNNSSIVAAPAAVASRQLLGGESSSAAHPCQQPRIPPPRRSASSTPKYYRSSRDPQPWRGVSSGDAAENSQQSRHRGDAIADGGGRLKGAVQSSPSRGTRRSGPYAQGRAMPKNGNIPKPGKQRLGPHKKKLSTLKKKILLDRLERWRDKQHGGGLSNPSATAASEEAKCSNLFPLCPPGGLSPPPSPPATICPAVVDKSTSYGQVGGGIGERNVWAITIYNLVDEEDVEDDDDHAEIERDLWDMSSAFGVVRSVQVPRGTTVQVSDAQVSAAATAGEPAAVAAKVAFATNAEAECARDELNGRIVGGKPLLVRRHRCDGDFGGGICPGDPDGSGLWRVAIENLIDEEDDLDDEDEYAEISANVSTMMGCYGKLVDVQVRRSSPSEGEAQEDVATRAATTAGATQAVVVTFGSLAEAEACVQGIKGCRVGGKELDAHVVHDSERVLPPSPVLKCDDQEHARQSDVAIAVAGQGESAMKKEAGMERPPCVDQTTAAAVASSTEWYVVIRGLIDEDDLQDDDDDYAEVCSDVTGLVSSYGAVVGLDIPRGRETGICCYGAEPGEAVVAFRSLQEAEACARGLSGRKVAGNILDAQVLTQPTPSQQGTLQGGASGTDPPVVHREWKPAKGCTLPQQQSMATPPSHQLCGKVAELHVSGPGLLGGIGNSGEDDRGRPKISFTDSDEPQATAAAAPPAHSIEGPKTAALAKAGKRIPMKYQEAAALPKPPGISGGGSPNAYVHQPPDKEANDLVFEMLQLLFKFQERARLSDPAKAKTRRRLVIGLREVLRGVKAKKVRLLIVAPNVDAVGGEGGLDDKVVEIIDKAREEETPVVFALSKRKIGKALGKTIKVSAVGVYSFDGANEQQKQLKRRMETISSLPSPAPRQTDPPTDDALASPPSSSACGDSQDPARKV